MLDQTHTTGCPTRPCTWSGHEAYTGSCSQCHGAAGDGRGSFGQTTFPPATDLTSTATGRLSDDQLFSIIKDGLGFTPMPGYASQYSDQQIWGLVSFIRALQSGQAPPLNVPTPTADQVSGVPGAANGDAMRGASVYAAEGYGACHGLTGDLSIAPTNRAGAQAGGGEQGGRPAGGEGPGRAGAGGEGGPAGGGQPAGGDQTARLAPAASPAAVP